MYAKNSQLAFNLVELMVVIAIIGLLAAIALPAYNDYLVRSRVSEMINASAAAKANITEYRLSKNVMPTSNAQANVTSIRSKFVRSIQVRAGGVVTVVGNVTNLSSSSALNIVLTPTYVNGSVTWTCSATGQTKYVPGSCK